MSDNCRAARMKKKKKAGRRAAPAAEDDELDEREALQAIYGAAFALAADGKSFSIHVRAAASAEALDADGFADGSASSVGPAVLLVRALLCDATLSCIGASAARLRRAKHVRRRQRHGRKRNAWMRPNLWRLFTQSIAPKVGYPRRLPHIHVEAGAPPWRC